MLKTLTEMQVDEWGTISTLDGGKGLSEKLDNMSLYIGKEIKLISKHSRKGPVIIKVGNTQIAIGFGIAQKIFIEAK
ncbi:ferrous iron transport protein A [bacterium]|nr:ferrous iron transport protein A [bacterium]